MHGAIIVSLAPDREYEFRRPAVGNNPLSAEDGDMTDRKRQSSSTPLLRLAAQLLCLFVLASCSTGSYSQLQRIDLDASILQIAIPSVMFTGEGIPAAVRVRNTGSASWTANTNINLNLSYQGSNGRSITIGPGRVLLFPEETIESGNEKTFAFDLRAPEFQGNITISPQIVLESSRYVGQRASVITTILFPPPALIEPAEGSTLDSGSPPTFRWTAIDGAASYTLTLLAPGLEQPLTFSQVLQSHFQVPPETWASATSGRYFWGVAAVDAQGEAGALTMQSFNRVRHWPDPPPLFGLSVPIPLGPGNATAQADPVTFRWTSLADAISYRVEFTLPDGRAIPVDTATPEFTLTNEHWSSLPAGHYTWRVAANGPMGTGNFSPPLRFTKITTNRAGSPDTFGLDEHIFPIDPSKWPEAAVERGMTMLQRAGVKWVKVAIQWAFMQSADGTLDWTVPDRFVAKAREHQINLVWMLSTPPASLLDPSARQVAPYYQLIPDIPADWNDRQGYSPTFFAFMKQLIARYKPFSHVPESPTYGQPYGVRYWAMGVEANNTIFGEIGPKQYLQGWLKPAFLAKHEVDREAKILAMLAYIPDPHGTVLDLPDPTLKNNVIDYVNGLRDLGAQDFFDIAGVSIYTDARRAPESVEKANSLDQTAVRRGIRFMKAAFPGKPVWVTEAGWGADLLGPGDGRCVSLQEQAAYVPILYDTAVTEGAEKVFWFGFRDSLQEGEFPCGRWLGLVDLNFIPKPSWEAYKRKIEGR